MNEPYAAVVVVTLIVAFCAFVTGYKAGWKRGEENAEIECGIIYRRRELQRSTYLNN